MPMLCVSNGRVSVQVWHIKREKWVYIPIRKWILMTDKQRNRYSVD